jgi:ribosomal protein S20
MNYSGTTRRQNMNKYKKILGIGLGFVALIVVAGATMAFSRGSAMADENDLEKASIFQPMFDLAGQAEPGQEPFKGRAFFTEALAEALGIPVEDLKAARLEALEAALDQAVAEGIITQQQADLLADNPRPARPVRPGLRGMAYRVFNDRGIHRVREIWDAALADALGLSVEELQAARQEALETTLEQAVEEGVLSEERAEIMLARAALAATLDPDAILAQVLGITTDDLQAARDEGKTLAELVEELGLDPATIRDNMVATREQVIQQAVGDGVITPEQAELLQNRPVFGFCSRVRSYRPLAAQ